MPLADGRTKIPRLGEPDRPYPKWLREGAALDLGRTVAVSGVPSPAMRGAVRVAFCREFGEDSIDECTAPEPFAKTIYVRFKPIVSAQEQPGDERTGCKERTGCQCAFEAVDSKDQVPPCTVRACACQAGVKER